MCVNISCLTLREFNQDSKVGIAVTLLVSRSVVSIPAGVRIVFFSENSRSALEYTATPINWERDLFPWAKWPECDGEHLTIQQGG
jgi:hypothetical protein